MQDAVTTFLDAADWLGDADKPAISALRNCAESLDNKWQSSMVVQFRLLYNDLANKGGTATEPDEQQAFLDELDV